MCCLRVPFSVYGTATKCIPRPRTCSQLSLPFKDSRRILHTSSVRETSKQSSLWRHVRRIINIDNIFAISASLGGIASLYFYNNLTNSDARTIVSDENSSWPDAVAGSVKSTFLYYTVGAVMSVGVASILSRGRTFRLLPWCTTSALVTTTTSILCQSYPYKTLDVDRKHLSWMLHNSALGCAIAPLALAGRPLVLRLSSYLAGGLLALAVTALYAQNERQLKLGGLSALCLGGVSGALVSRLVAPNLWKLQPPVSSLILVYIGVIGVGGLVWYNAGKVVERAELRFANGQRYDPINNALGIYMDLIHPRYCSNY